MDCYQKVEDFLKPAELSRIMKIVDNKMGEAHETSGKKGIGPRYRIIDGDQILNMLPEVQALGEERVLPVMEEFAGKKLALLASSKRSMRIQQYAKKEHGFRWHCDGNSYIALIALKNTNRGRTDFISPRLSWFLRYPLYPVRFFDRLCATFPYESVSMDAGDMLVMNGSISLHRGVTVDEEGERLLVAYAFDEIGKKSNSIREWIARKMNY